MREFFVTTIGDQLTLQRGFDITKKEQRPGDIPVVSSGGVSSFHSEAKVSSPGVVLGRKGSLGTVFYMEVDFWPHDTTLWVKDFKGNSPRFVYYFFLSMAVELKRMDVGAANPALNRNHVHPLTATWPSRKHQDKIAHILGTLDDKIELNRQMNATLESMAQALFKSWFVDFDPVIDNALAAGNPIPESLQARAEMRAALGDNRKPLPEAIQQQFPNRFVFTEEMGWVPEGWRVLPLAEVTSTIIDHRGKTPTKLGDDWSESGYPAISAKNVKSGQIIKPDAIRFVSDDLYRKWMKVPLEPGDFALTSEAPLGETYYFGRKTDYLLSQRLFGIRANPHHIPGVFLYLWFNSALCQSELENRATGTTVVGIRQAELQKVPVLCPERTLTNSFANQAQAIFSLIDTRSDEIKTLTKFRDTLLPKLLSGELRIPEAEKQVAEAV